MKGLLKGLATTAKVLARGSHTAQYPHTSPDLPDRSRGVIALLADNCTSCMLCARECPAWCIYIDSHKEEIPPATEGGRARSHNVLDRFDLDYSLCMYCGICIEVCPFDALFWAPDFAYAEGDIRNLLHDKERLGTWMEHVPQSTWPDNYYGYGDGPGAYAPAPGEDSAGPEEPETGESGTDAPAQGKTGHGKTAQGKTGQDETAQGKTGQDETGQGKTGQGEQQEGER